MSLQGEGRSTARGARTSFSSVPTQKVNQLMFPPADAGLKCKPGGDEGMDDSLQVKRKDLVWRQMERFF